jgi:hypothetical protein
VKFKKLVKLVQAKKRTSTIPAILDRCQNGISWYDPWPKRWRLAKPPLDHQAQMQPTQCEAEHQNPETDGHIVLGPDDRGNQDELGHIRVHEKREERFEHGVPP